MNPLRYLSVCSGIEAATVAWHPLGMIPVAFSEIESFPCAVLQHHYPHVPNLGDMTQFKTWPDYAIDILVGGTPCQSFSVAGLRKGLADPRGNLALTFLAIAHRYRPRWVVWENVPGVHSSWSDGAVRDQTEACGEVESSVRHLALEAGLDGETIASCGGFEEADQSSDFDCFLAGLEELGYGVASTILDAQFFGVAQRRERVFVVGHLGGQWQRAAGVLFERAGLCGHPAPRREKREGIAPTISARTEGGGGLGTDFDLDGGLVEDTGVIPIQEIGKRTGRSTEDVACGIGIGEQHDPMFTLQQGAVHGVCATLTKNYATHHGRSAGNNGGVAENQLIPTAIRTANTNANGHGISEECAHTLDGALGQAIAFIPVLADGFDASEDGTGRSTPLWPCELAPTINAHFGEKQGLEDQHINSGAGMFVPATMAVRRLTPRECERLQAFLDNYTLIPYRGKPADQCPDGPRYKALGNSMCVNVVRWIGERILQVEAISSKGAVE